MISLSHAQSVVILHSRLEVLNARQLQDGVPSLRFELRPLVCCHRVGEADVHKNPDAHESVPSHVCCLFPEERSRRKPGVFVNDMQHRCIFQIHKIQTYSSIEYCVLIWSMQP